MTDLLHLGIGLCVGVILGVFVALLMRGPVPPPETWPAMTEAERAEASERIRPRVVDTRTRRAR